MLNYLEKPINLTVVVLDDAHVSGENPVMHREKIQSDLRPGFEPTTCSVQGNRAVKSASGTVLMIYNSPATGPQKGSTKSLTLSKS